MKQVSPTSVVTRAPFAKIFGSNTSKARPKRADPAPNISCPQSRTSAARRYVNTDAAKRVRKRMRSAYRIWTHGYMLKPWSLPVEEMADSEETEEVEAPRRRSCLPLPGGTTPCRSGRRAAQGKRE